MAAEPPGAPRHSARDRAPVARPRWFRPAILLLSLAIVAAGALLALQIREGPREVARSVFGSAVGGSFRLTDQNGKRVADTDLRGKWLLVYFGYTHCPDACPTALNDMALALRDLGTKAAQFRPVFISIDPARDTPPVMKAYVANFDAPILALTGSPAEVAQAARGYHVYYARHPEAGGDYSMDHSSLIYVMTPKGRFAASLDETDTPAQMADRLKQLIG